MRRACRNLQTPVAATAFCVMALAGGAQAQEATPSMEGSAPRPLDQPAPPEARKNWYVTPGFSIPLSSGGVGGDETGDRTGSSPVGFVGVTYSPKESWFAGATFYGYPDDRQEWQGDFSYSFGYDDWRPNTFSLVYSNYANNRFSPEDDDPITRPELGTISAGYKFRLPEAIRSPAADEGDEGRVNCRVGYHYTPRYETDLGPDRHNKQSASAGCRLPIYKRFFADLTAYGYTAGEQQPWDPDYTYSFGWFDWRPNHFSVQYTNYSGTRFPWRDSTSRTGGFEDGAVSVTYNLAF
jgi:hypothetical protein